MPLTRPQKAKIIRKAGIICDPKPLSVRIPVSRHYLVYGGDMHTTLNIRNDIFQRIEKAAKIHKKSSPEMIYLLLEKFGADIPNSGKIGVLVQYQTRRNPEDWHRHHVKVREDMYEYWLDMRKLLKMSVSLILAKAVEKFLRKKLKLKSTDNNLFKNYIIMKEIVDSVIVWKFIWGWPPDLGKFMTKNS